MNTKFEFKLPGEDRIVYVRPVAADDLPEDVQGQLGGLKTLYAVHSADGERLALVKDRQLAFVLARQNDLAPVTVH
ncbi:DUF1150 domain-containing protein [Salipiger sp. P9]|uniref:DUF1150 domain-containing protein n=1 Tax=Salipiger pentaromativorans TaxID=2943193 RepID=UPI0021574992|nr:DUF1150 domain-containing protein [Salipiger pentaromativorans]MCR8546784.1 DUF1150 domain-containing protein [Salipiger pentaromativorans]